MGRTAFFSRCALVCAAASCSAALALTAAGCGSSGSHGSAPAPDGGHAALPQLVYDGGPLVAAARVVSVTFQGDPQTADLDTFGASITASAWWNTVRADFCTDAGVCVGEGPTGTSVQVATAAPTALTDSDQGGSSTVQAWLTSALGAGTLPAPDPGPTSNTVYVLYFPSTTAITFDGLTSCADEGFAGYHNSTMLNGQRVPYAVVAECTPLPSPITSVPALTELQTTTVTTSHEVLETATDPDGQNGFTLDLGDVNNWAWVDILGGDEAADLCVDPFGINQDVASSGAFSVQRIWSNTAAAGGHDPCIPAPAGQVYFNAAPRKAFYVLDVGESVTFAVDAFADGTTADWTLAAQDWSASSATTYLGLSIAGGTVTNGVSKIQVNNGKTVEVTATLLVDPSGLPTAEADGAMVSVAGTAATTIVAHWWPFAVMTKAEAIQEGIQPSRRIPAHKPARRVLAAAMTP
jgi:hypothetical protein